MKIIEIRDGFIKFEADKSVYLSSFIQIKGDAKSYIAQVYQFKTFGDISIASAKILFLLVDGQLKNYDRTEPSKDAEIQTFTLDILNNSIYAKKPVIVGKTPDNSGYIKIDSSAFEKKMLMSIDDKNMNEILLSNLSKQFENLGINTIVIDTLGITDIKKYRAGVDFKLPLDTNSLQFMYESCLNDATSESKSLIIEIFKELSDYSQTVSFVPFSALKNIVDDMVDKQHVFRLLVLKNKLAKFDKMGYFASNQEDVDKLDKILNQNNPVIDLSGMDILFQNRYLSFIYEKLKEYKNIQVFLEIANTVSKKNLKHIIVDSEIPTSLITHSRFQYLNDIKNMFDNFIIEPTITNNTVFQVYSTFLSSMKKDTYLIAGEAINYIPLVSQIQQIDEFAEPSEFVEPEKTLQEPIENIQEVESESVSNDEQTFTDEDSATEEDNSEIIDISIDETENNNVVAQEDIIATIDEKSENAIDSIAASIEEPKELELFDDVAIETEQEELSDNFTEQEESFNADNSDILVNEAELPTENNSKADDSVEEISEMEIEDVQADSLISDLTEINEASVNIGDVSDDEIIIDDTENNNEEFTEELSEEMLDDLNTGVNAEVNTEESQEINIDENIEVSSEEFSDDEILLQEQDFEQADVDRNSDNEELDIDGDIEESSIELDGDVEELIDVQNDDEVYPQNTNLDVDFSEPQVIPATGEALNHDFDEIVELDSSESSSNDIVVDMSGEDDRINVDEEREQEILEEVEKVYTTIKEENDDDTLEEISDSDLDMIDELNNDGDELEEYHGELEEISDSDSGIIEETHLEPEVKQNDANEILEHKESTTPIVPMYDADIPQEDMVVSDPIQQGDAVIHAKYGNGVVEKMIKYGSKTLFAINFENIGRRLLDPTLTEIKKV